MTQLIAGIRGWADVVVRRADGSVREHRTIANIMTNSGRRQMASILTLGDNVAISDDLRPAGIMDGMNMLKADLQTPGAIVTPTRTWDPGARTISHLAVYTSPSTPPRTVRMVALVTGADASGGTITKVVAYFPVSPAITLGGADTLEITYRQQFVFPGKSSKRWASTSLANTRQWADLMGALTLGLQSVAYSPYFAYGRHFFTDEEARYCRYFDGGDGGWAAADTTPGPGSNTDANTMLVSRGYGTLKSFDLNVAGNSLKVGSLGSTQGGINTPWDTTGGVTGTNMTPAFGFQPLATAEGPVSTVFAHPVGETYLFNVPGSPALSAGQVLVTGPYRPANEIVPTSRAYRANIRVAGGTGGGTEALYDVEYGPHAFNGVLTSDQALGVDLKYLYRTHQAAQQPWATQNKTSLVSDGRGGYWATGHYDGNRSALFFWKAGTNEEVQCDVAQDNTRFYGLAQSTELVPTINQGGQRYAPPGLASNEAGLVFYPTRDPGAGLQAIYVIDQTQPGRQYQRPTGQAVGGSTTFTVSATDDIHAMFPFAPADAGAARQIRITTGPNAGIRTIALYNSPTSVNFTGGNLVADANMTWHWIVVTKRDSTNGLADKVRTLAYDRGTSRLWAFLDTGLQVSTNFGASWSPVKNFGSGALTTVDAEQARPPDGENAHASVAFSPAGDVYWVDTLGGVNKFVGTAGPHTRLSPADFVGTGGSITGPAVYGIALDPLACHLATGTGALWVTQADDASAASFWRIDLNVAFAAGNLVTYTNPTVPIAGANLLARGPTHVIVGPAGRVHMANKQTAVWVYWDPGTDTFFDGDVVLDASHVYENAWGAHHVDADGLTVSMTAQGESQRFFGQVVKLLWDDVALVWRPWHGTGTQFNTRYIVTNLGRRKAHAAAKLVRDNVRVAFQQDGGVLQVDEYRAGETFTWLGTFGVHRTNIQDLAWSADTSWAEPTVVLEDETVRTSAGRGSLQVFWRADNTAVTTINAASLGAGIPSLDAGGQNFGWMPRRHSGLYNAPANGPVPDTLMTGGHRSMCAAIDLGSLQVVAKVRLHAKLNSILNARFYGNTATGSSGRFRLHWSDDNAAWTEVTAARLVAGNVAGPAEPDAAYANVDIELNDGGTDGSDFASAWAGLTFDLVRAGLSAGARTHRYWKVVLSTGEGEAGIDNTFNSTIMGSLSCLDGSGAAIGLASALQLPEFTDPTVLANQVIEAAWLQDRVGLLGKGGINSVPDAFADGYTDTVTIASGMFDTLNINVLTDLLAYRHPSTGAFLRPAGAVRGSPGARGEQTAVRIIARTTTQIIVATRNIPDSLSAVDWEVRRPLVPTIVFPNPGEIAYDPAAQSLAFHATELGREFKITRRAVIRRS